MKKFFLYLLVAALAAVPTFAAKKAKGKAAKDNTLLAAKLHSQDNLSLEERKTVDPQNPSGGLTDGERAAVLDMVLKSSPMKDSLQGSRYRVFAVNDTVVKTPGGLQKRAYTLLYDYTKNKAYQVVNDITAGAPGAIIETNVLDSLLPPTVEEYAEAKEMVAGLDQVKALIQGKKVVLQEGFPPDSPAPCNVDRCVQIQVNEIFSGGRSQLLSLVTVDLSAHKVVEVRDMRNLSQRKGGR